MHSSEKKSQSCSLVKICWSFIHCKIECCLFWS